MKIHYCNGKGQERFIDGVIHLQNVDNEHFTALMENGCELTLRADRIEGICDSSVIEEKMSKRKVYIEIEPVMKRLHHLLTVFVPELSEDANLSINQGIRLAIEEIKRASAADAVSVTAFIDAFKELGADVTEDLEEDGWGWARSYGFSMGQIERAIRELKGGDDKED